MQYDSDRGGPEPQWNNIARSLEGAKAQGQYRSRNKYSPYVSRHPWQRINNPDRQQPEAERAAPKPSPSLAPAYMGQARPRNPSTGSLYRPRQTSAIGPAEPAGQSGVYEKQAVRAQPIEPKQAQLHSPWTQAAGVYREPQYFSSYTPPQVSDTPSFTPHFQASYTNFDGGVSTQPDYSLRDAFVQSINDSMIPYQTGQRAGPPQFDFESLLSKAQEMSRGGFQNPLAALIFQ